MTPLIRLQKIGKCFSKKNETIEVLRSIDLVINSGEKVAIVGRSGAGKSTLLHILGTLEEVSSGEYYYREQKVHQMKASALAAIRNQKMGFVFQFHYLLPEFTALENVMMPLLISGMARKLALAKAEFWLDQVGLSSRVQHFPNELSGGERQRVALARALVNQPEVVFTDEVTGNLDSKTARKIQDLLYQLHQTHQTTLISVTHDLNIANEYDKILRIEDGQLLSTSGSTNEEVDTSSEQNADNSAGNITGQENPSAPQEPLKQ